MEDRGPELDFLSADAAPTCGDGAVEWRASAALSGAVGCDLGFDDADLAEVVERWVMLSDDQRNAVLVVVRG